MHRANALPFALSFFVNNLDGMDQTETECLMSL